MDVKVDFYFCQILRELFFMTLTFIFKELVPLPYA